MTCENSEASDQLMYSAQSVHGLFNQYDLDQKAKVWAQLFKTNEVVS